jgi:hypothetical protein
MMAWYRIKDIANDDLGLKAEDRINVIAMAMNEWAIYKALVIIHGDRAAQQRYIDMGGHVRFDDDDEPCVWYVPKKVRPTR